MSDSVWPHRWQPTRLPRPRKNTGVGCHFLLQCMKVKSESEIAQSCLTLSDPMDCSLPGSSVHGIFQARVLEWGAIAFSDKILHLSLIHYSLSIFPHQNLSSMKAGTFCFVHWWILSSKRTTNIYWANKFTKRSSDPLFIFVLPKVLLYKLHVKTY